MNQALFPCLNVANDSFDGFLYRPVSDEPMCFNFAECICPSDPVHLLPQDDCKDTYDWLMAFGRDLERIFAACGHNIHLGWSYLLNLFADPSNTLFKSVQQCLPEDDERIYEDEALLEQELGTSEDKNSKVIEITAQENRINVFNERMSKSAI